MGTELAFDPSNYVTRVNGSEYLEVKWRLLWLRRSHPTARVETQLVEHLNNTAVFKATVEVPEGGSATGWGSETAGDFRDYVEKAETKALGRALAALGFGTQFCPDFEFSANPGRVVDAAAGQLRESDERNLIVQNVDAPATERQLEHIRNLIERNRISDEQLGVALEHYPGVTQIEELRRADASRFINDLQSPQRRDQVAS